jgi:uncharacterized iron-regulated protein
MELESVVSKVSSARVIYLGETHDSYADHLTQLEIIRLLHRKNPNIAIAMEQFQQPFQSVLDRFISGELDEKGLIRQSEWMERWRFDYRLYRPILSYAREQRIPVIALNISKEIIAKVSKSGIDGLSKDEQKKIPSEIDYSDNEYRERLEKIFEKHPHKNENGFERFMQVQLLWDEGMAERAAEYLKANQKHQLIVLAGTGHLMYGSGIPQRVSRRVQGERAIILPAGEFPLEQGVADFLVQGRGEQLPERGMLGLYLVDSEEGVKVTELIPEGNAIKAGVEEYDLILKVNGKEVKDIVDLKMVLIDESPGSEVTLGVLRRSLLQKDKELDLSFKLGK